MDRSTQDAVKALAKEAARHFTRATPRKVVALKDGAPEWVQDMVYEAHDGMLPDDYKYEFAQEAVDAIADADDVEDVRLEGDVYVSDLLAWLNTNVCRMAYCDEACEEYGLEAATDLETRMRVGQEAEKAEVLGIVLRCLEERADATEGEG